MCYNQAIVFILRLDRKFPGMQKYVFNALQFGLFPHFDVLRLNFVINMFEEIDICTIFPCVGAAYLRRKVIQLVDRFCHVFEMHVSIDRFSSFKALNASGLDVSGIIDENTSSPELAILVTCSISMFSPMCENEHILSLRASIKFVSNPLVKDLTTSLSLRW